MDFSGLQEVAYSDTLGGARTSITGKVEADGTIEPDNTKNEAADGSQVYGGSLVNVELGFMDMADFDTIEGFMTANTEKFWHFIFKDGHELSTQEAINPFVHLTGGVNARDGVAAWMMDFERYSHIPVLGRTAAP